MNQEKYIVILFYKFTKIKNPEAFKIKQREIAKRFSLLGRMLVAPEGINATFEGTAKNIKSYIKELRKQAIFKNVVFKDSAGNGKGFTKLMVKTRPEVVTLGVGEFNIKKETAPVITATELQKCIIKMRTLWCWICVMIMKLKPDILKKRYTLI